MSFGESIGQIAAKVVESDYWKSLAEIYMGHTVRIERRLQKAENLLREVDKAAEAFASNRSITKFAELFPRIRQHLLDADWEDTR